MILPLGDAPNPRGVPLVTYAILLANVAVYVLVNLPLGVQPVDPRDPALLEYARALAEGTRGRVPVDELLRRLSAYDLFVFRHGFRPAEPQVADLFASLFLHAGFAHLFGNMLFLWIYGDNVEHRLGRVRYLLAYLATGVAATLFHYVFDADSRLPLIGASGAISGLLGFYFIWFPHNQVRLLFLLFPLFMNVVTVPARILLGLYLLADNLFPFLLTRGMGGGGVAYGAHIGGFLAGLAAAWVMDRREVVRPPREYAAARRRVPTDKEAIEAAIAAGEPDVAAERYFALPPHATRGLLGPEHSLALGEWLRQHGHDQAALAVFRRHLRDYPQGPGTAAAHFGAGLIQLEAFGQPAAAYQHFLDALDADPPPALAAELRAALAAIAARQKFQVGRPRARRW
jgi:membrane associated rhomboid family serine protease